MRTQSPRFIRTESSGVGSKCGSEACSFTATAGPSVTIIPSSRKRLRMNSAMSNSLTPESTFSPMRLKASPTICVSLSAANRCDASCSSFHRCVAY